MSVVDLVMPKLGESIMEATILKWLKKPGDAVKQDETVLDIATDKVDSEVPSTASGVIEEILFNVNDVVPIGTVIARIKTNVPETISSKPVHSAPKETHSNTTQEAEVVESFQTTNYKPQTTNGTSNRFYSPLV